MNEESVPNDLGRYVMVPIWRWRAVLAVTLAVLLAVAAFLLVGPRTYKSTALVELHAITTAPFDGGRPANQTIDVATEMTTASSRTVADKASQLLSGHPDPGGLQKAVTVTAATGTTTLSFLFAADNADDATAGANGMANAYLAVRKASAQQRRDGLVQPLQASLSGLRGQLAKVNQALAGADPSSAAAQDALTTRTLLTQQISDLDQRINSLTGMSLDPGQVISPANTPTVSPNTRIVLLGGLLIGLVLGGVAAFAREVADPRLRRADQMDAVIGTNVVVTSRMRADVPPDDAIYVLRARVLREARDGGVQALLVVDWSAKPSAGAVGKWLGELVAETGARVQTITIGAETGPGESERRRHADLGWGQLSRRWAGRPAEWVSREKLQAVIDEGRAEGALTLLVPASRPRRSIVVEYSALVDGVVLVAESGMSRLALIRGSVRDVHDSGSRTTAGVLIRGRRFRRARLAPGPTLKHGPTTADASAESLLAGGLVPPQQDPAGRPLPQNGSARPPLADDPTAESPAFRGPV